MRRGRAIDAGAGVAFRVALGAVLVFCLAPVVLIAGLSFFKDGLVEFPPKQLTLELYGEVFGSSHWREALVKSFALGIPTAILVVLVVTPAAIALDRGRLRGAGLVEFAMLLPMLLPASGYAVALYVIYIELGWTGDYPTLVFAEAIVAAPIAFLIMRAGLQRMPRHLDFVAMSLGASRSRAIWDVTVNLLRPAIFASIPFILVHVFDDVVFVTFLGGPSNTTLGKSIFESLSYKLDPVVLPLSVVLMVLMGALVAVGTTLQQRAR